MSRQYRTRDIDLIEATIRCTQQHPPAGCVRVPKEWGVNISGRVGILMESVMVKSTDGGTGPGT